jgi:hypothetical protein
MQEGKSARYSIKDSPFLFCQKKKEMSIGREVIPILCSFADWGDDIQIDSVRQQQNLKDTMKACEKD